MKLEKKKIPSRQLMIFSAVTHIMSFAKQSLDKTKFIPGPQDVSHAKNSFLLWERSLVFHKNSLPFTAGCDGILL